MRERALRASADAAETLRSLRWTAPAAAAALVSLALGAAAALAVFGLYRLDAPVPLETTPRLTIDPIPAPSWELGWSPVLRLADAIRGDGLDALLRLAAAFGACVLAVALAAAGTVQLSRATARRYETAVRAIVGAAPGRLSLQFLLDGLLLAVAAAAAALLLGRAGGSALAGSWPHGAPAGPPDARIAWLPIASIAAVMLATSLAPRLRMARRGWIGDAIAPEARTNPGMGAEDVRRLLVVAQFSAALLLAGTAGLLFRHAAPGAGPVGPGYDPSNRYAVVLEAPAPDAAGRGAALAALEERLRAAPAIEAEGLASAGAIVGAGAMDRVLSNCPWCSLGGLPLPLIPVFSQVHVAGPGFFDTLGVAFIGGRDFARAAERGDVVVVNEAFAARAFQGRDALGRRVQLGGFAGKWFTVVGIVGGIPRIGIGVEGGPQAGPGASGYGGDVPAVYLPAAAYPPARLELVVRSRSPEAELERVLRPALAGTGIVAGRVVPVAARLERERAPLAWFGRVIAALAAIVLGLAVHGLYALMRFTVSLRQVEIGVRRAAGAPRGAIARQFLGEALVLTAWGVLPGLAGAVTVARTIRPLFPGLPAFDGRVFAACTLVLAIAVLLGAWLPARGAARLQPADALRRETG